MLNKNDPLIGAVQEVMKKNQAERDAVKLVNEKFGIQDRKVLPHERQHEWETVYKTVLNESKSLAALAPPHDKVTHKDVLVGRGVLKKKGDQHVVAEDDTTSPSEMGIKKPDYATGTPDYAKSKEQTVNRDVKTSLPPGTMKEAHSIVKKIIAKKKMNEGFNGRHSLSVTASAEKQTVVEQAKARSDFGLGAIPGDKNGAANRAKIDKAMEPVVNTVKAVTPGATAFDKATQGDYKGAAVDAAIDVAGGAVVGGVARAGKALYNFAKGSKAATGVEKAAAGVTKALPAPAKPVSQAAREPAAVAATKTPTAVDKFIAKAKQTPVTPAAREGGNAGIKAAANASKFSRPGTAGGRFSDKLAQARKNAGSDPKAKQLPALRRTTEPTVATRPNVPAVIKKPSTAVATRPTVATRPNVPAGGATRIVGLSDKAKLGLGAGAAAAGTAAISRGFNNQPPPAQATPLAKPSGATAQPYGMKTPQKPAPAPAPAVAKPVAAKPVAAKPAAAKPVAAKPVAAKPVSASAVKSKPQTRYQRDNTIGADGKPTKGPGGVKSGTTIKQKATVKVKRRAGTGREK